MNFKNAVIRHGTMGSPDINWFQWLKTELTSRGLEVWLPQMPSSSQPSLRQEADYIHTEYPFDINEETLIVGHSSGAILALIVAQENQIPVGVVVAVSVFHDNSLKWDANPRLLELLERKGIL